MKYLKKFENKEPVKKVEYYDNGNIQSVSYKLNGEVHREDGPAYQTWFENGQKRAKYYYIDGKINRVDGPAFQNWYENGQQESEQYIINDLLHREDGPAYQEWSENGQLKHEEYYIDGDDYKRENWLEELKKMNSPYYDNQKMLYDAEKYNL